MRNRFFLLTLMVAVMAIVVLPLGGCKKADQASEEAADAVRDAAEATGEAVAEGIEAAGDMAADAGETIEEGVEAAGEMVGEGVEADRKSVV